jgi:hypothetical protein
MLDTMAKALVGLMLYTGLTVLLYTFIVTICDLLLPHTPTNFHYWALGAAVLLLLAVNAQALRKR